MLVKNGPTATSGLFGMFEWPSPFSGQLCVYHQAFLIRVCKPVELKSSTEKRRWLVRAKMEDLWHGSVLLAVGQVAAELSLDWGVKGKEEGEIPYSCIQLQLVSLIMHTTLYNLGV